MYDAWRENGFATLYPPNRTSATADILLAGFLYAFVILGVALFVVPFGYRGKRVYANAVIIYGELLILAFIILCNFGQEWEVGTVANASVQYKAGVREEIHADISLKIGLRSVNITLKTDPTTVPFNGGKTNETIDYNERFSWNNMAFTAGRPGFGPYAGLFNKQYKESKEKGTPYPIMRVAQYFTLDGGVFRWGRFYRQAGYYAHIMMWLAFPLWIITILLFKTALRPACWFCMLTGLTLWGANLICWTLRNPVDLTIKFTAQHVLTVSWGWCFWLNFVTACLTLITGAILYIIDLRCKNYLAPYFGIDIAQSEDAFRENHFITPNVAVVPQNSSKEDQIYSRAIMSARPGERGYGPSQRFYRQETFCEGVNKDPTVTHTPDTTEHDKVDDTISVSTDDQSALPALSGSSPASTSHTSCSSGHETPCNKEPSSGQSGQPKSGRKTRKISPETPC